MADSSLGTVIVIGWKHVLNEGGVYPFVEFADLKFDQMFVISETLAYADTSGYPQNIHAVPDEAARVFTHRVKPDSTRAYYQHLPHSMFSPNLDFARNTDSRVTYVCFDEKIANSAFKLAALVKTETLQNRLWAVAPNVRKGVKIPRSHFYAIPDVFTGPENVTFVKSKLPSYEAKYLKTLIELGINHLRMYLRAGYHLRDNKIPVDGWALQIASPWLSLIISLNKIVPGYIDADVSRELFESSTMRKLVCDKTLCALSNYFVFAYDGDKITADTLLRFKEEDGGDVHEMMFQNGKEYVDDTLAWSSEKLWRYIYFKYMSSLAL